MKDSWKELHIGNEVNILSGYPFDSKKFNREKEGKPLIRIRDILESSINTYFSGSYPETFLIKRGDILIGMDGDFHVAKWNNIDALLNQRILKVHQKKDAKIDIDYFYYFLQPFLKKVHDITAATTVKHLSTFDIIKARKKFPEVIQQQKIAKILNTVEAVIKKTEKAIAKYQAIKKGMMHDLFTRGIDLKTGKLRPSYKDEPELYKESELGMIPREWEETKLGNEGTFRKGNNIPKYNLSSSGKSCVLYGQIYTHYDDLVKVFDSKIPEELSVGMSVLKSGDILFAGSGETHEDIGKCITYIGNDEVYPGGDIVILSLFKENHHSFFGYYLNYEFIQKQKAKLGQGSSVIHIYKGHLEVIDISVPQPNEQFEISERLIQIDLLINNEKQTLAKHQKIKKGLMQDLLTGKVEVKI
jgi:type I restriction enzyme S subunit